MNEHKSMRMADTCIDSTPEIFPTHLIMERDKLIMEQENDPELSGLGKKAVTDEIMTTPECFFMQSGVFVRKWRPRNAPAIDEWRTVYQIVVPKKKQKAVLSIAHELTLAGHLRVNKTYQRVLTHFISYKEMLLNIANFLMLSGYW